MYDQNAVKIKYISINIEPNGRIPDAGMTNDGSAYHGACGIGLFVEGENHFNSIV